MMLAVGEIVTAITGFSCPSLVEEEHAYSPSRASQRQANLSRVDVVYRKVLIWIGVKRLLRE